MYIQTHALGNDHEIRYYCPQCIELEICWEFSISVALVYSNIAYDTLSLLSNILNTLFIPFATLVKWAHWMYTIFCNLIYTPDRFDLAMRPGTNPTFVQAKKRKSIKCKHILYSWVRYDYNMYLKEESKSVLPCRTAASGWRAVRPRKALSKISVVDLKCAQAFINQKVCDFNFNVKLTPELPLVDRICVLWWIGLAFIRWIWN